MKKYKISITEILEQEIEADSIEEAIMKLANKKSPQPQPPESESDPKILPPDRNDLSDPSKWKKVK